VAIVDEADRWPGARGGRLGLSDWPGGQTLPPHQGQFREHIAVAGHKQLDRGLVEPEGAEERATGPPLRPRHGEEQPDGCGDQRDTA
jgi:hypothetical protein